MAPIFDRDFLYDDLGNRLETVFRANTEAFRQAEYNDVNQRLRERRGSEQNIRDHILIHDRSGQELAVYEIGGVGERHLVTLRQFDSLGRMTHIDDSIASWTAAYRGLLFHKTRESSLHRHWEGPATTFSYIYDGDNVLMEHGNDVAYFSIYAGELLLRRDRFSVAEDQSIDRASVYVLFDHLGSTAMYVDNTGEVLREYAYGAFGEPHLLTHASPADHHEREMNDFLSPRFISRPHREQLFPGYDFRFRHYDIMSGRFLSRDPIFYAGDINANLYSYSSNNPLNYIDLYGLFPYRGRIVKSIRDYLGGIISMHPAVANCADVSYFRNRLTGWLSLQSLRRFVIVPTPGVANYRPFTGQITLGDPLNSESALHEAIHMWDHFNNISGNHSTHSISDIENAEKLAYSVEYALNLFDGIGKYYNHIGISNDCANSQSIAYDRLKELFDPSIAQTKGTYTINDTATNKYLSQSDLKNNLQHIMFFDLKCLCELFDRRFREAIPGCCFDCGNYNLMGWSRHAP